MEKKKISPSAFASLRHGIVVINCVLLLLLGLIQFTSPSDNQDKEFMLFTLGYIPLLIYFLIYIITLFRYRADANEQFGSIYRLTLAAFYVSAYLLNHTVSVFAQFTSWTYPIIVATYLWLVFGAFDRTSRLLNGIIPTFILSILLTFAIYQTAFTLPVYPFGAIGLLAFGIGSHVLVPLLVVIALIRQLAAASSQKYAITSFTAGIFCIIVCYGYGIKKYLDVYKTIDNHMITMATEDNVALPSWVKLGMDISKDAYTQGIITGELAYQRLSFDFDKIDALFNVNQKINHPLISPLMLFEDQLTISREDRVRVLTSFFGDKSRKYKMIWSGESLNTKKVINQIALHPAYRLAYVQKDIYISSSNFLEEEALYTFDLPEGAIASSLSLWVGGVEEKSRLTSRCKADEAYSDIVGVQVRDPALMHWQEGNQVTVNVFPINRNLPRHFRVGFTVPMVDNGDMLAYNDVTFSGPQTEQTSHLWRVICDSCKDDIKGFKKLDRNTFEYTSKSTLAPKIAVTKPPLSTIPFLYKGESYHLQEAKNITIPKSFSAVFLDINQSWTKSEITTILEATKDKPTYVFQNGLIKIDSSNWKNLYATLQHHSANLFPYYEIADPQNSLLITKSIPNSPSLREIGPCPYTTELKAFISDHKVGMSVFDLSQRSGALLKLLSETNAVHLTNGDIKLLTKLINESEFIQFEPNRIKLQSAGIEIIKTKAPNATELPSGLDHLMRLYAYGHTMNAIGSRIFEKDLCSIESLQGETEKAHIVTPISSMLVLETAEDYKKFNIKENHGLANAKLKNSGAVPEPEEWALLLIAISFCLYYFRTHRIVPHA